MATRVQTASAVAASGAATITWPSATTAGNLLVAACVVAEGTANVVPPFGWFGNTVAVGSGVPQTRIFYRWNSPSETSSVFTPASGGIRVVAVEYAGVTNVINPLDDKESKAETSATTSFIGDSFTGPLYSSNDLVVYAVGCETAGLPFTGFTPAGSSVAVSTSQGGFAVALVDKLTAGSLVGPTIAWNASGASVYSIVQYAFFPADAIPIYATGGTSISGSASVFFSSDSHTYTGVGGFRVSGQSTPTIWNAIGGITLLGTPFLRASYIYRGGGDLSVGGVNDHQTGGNYSSAGGGTAISGLASYGVGVADASTGGFNLSGVAPTVLQYHYIGTAGGRVARLRGEATCAITTLHLAYAAVGDFEVDGDATEAITTLHLAYAAVGDFEVGGEATCAITSLNLAYEAGGGFTVGGDATEAITTIHLAYAAVGRFRVTGDATEAISSLNLAYQGGGAVALEGQASAYPSQLGSGGLRLRGAAEASILTANFEYQANSGRVVRIGGRMPHEVAYVYAYDASGDVTPGGHALVYGTGHGHAAAGQATISGEAKCVPGAAVHGSGAATFSGLADASWLVTHYQMATGQLAITGEAVVAPPLHQTGTGGGRLTGQGTFGKGYFFTFGSPEWWQKTGRFTLAGAAQVARSFEAVGGGVLAVAGTAGTQGPVGGVGEVGTLTGEAVTRYGPSFVGGGELCTLTGEQEPPVLGQKVFMTGRFAVSGLAELHTAHYGYGGSGRFQLAGSARSISLINFGNQDSEGLLSLNGDAEHKIGYAVAADGGIVLSGEARAAWGYTAAGGGEVAVTGHGQLENSFVYEPDGAVGLTGRAFLRMVFHHLYDAGGAVALSGAAPFGPAYDYSSVGGQRLSGVASAASYWNFRHDAVGAVVLGGRAHAVSTAVYVTAMAGPVSFGGSNDRQTRDIVSAAGSLGLRGECSTSGPNAPRVVDQGGPLVSQSCVITQSAFLNLLRTDSQLYLDLVALGSSKWSVAEFDCDSGTARLVVAGRTVDVTLPPTVDVAGDGRSVLTPRVRREVDPTIFRAAARPARPGGYRPVSGRAAAPVISKASLLARLPQSSPLRRELERVGVGGWEVVDRGGGRVAIRMQGRYLDLAVPA